MSKSIRSEILVVGGGIGGLCAALALRHAGLDVAVFERAAGPRQGGAGLALWSNAGYALQKLGLGLELQSIGASYTRIEFRTWRGDPLTAIPLETLIAKLSMPPLAIHRTDLQTLLLDALGEGVVQYNAQCTGYEHDETGIQLHFADGAEAYGDVLIGADGIHSVVRQQLFPESTPRYAGYTAWRGVTSFEHQETVFELWGQGRRFGFLPLKNDLVYWFATINAPEGGTTGIANDKRSLLDLFQGAYPLVEKVIEATAEDAILHNDIYDLKPLESWGHGCITLLGDAAHAMTPNLGQGACQAIEDALVLAESLRTRPGCAQALREYEQRRSKRTAMIIERSREIGRVAQWDNPLACTMRDALMKRTPTNFLFKPLDQIISYQV